MTPFGQKLRELRDKKQVFLKDMAAEIGVSAAYLSALEHGKRGMPAWYLVQRIIVYFNIIWDDAEELERLAQLSDPRVVLDTSGLAPVTTEYANRLAANISRLEPDQVQDMLLRLDGYLKSKSGKELS
jgi:transcriptional regulator with XRE-family HTH domain